MNRYLLWSIFLLGNLLHLSFFPLNDVLKIADSFAYLQMAHYAQDFSVGAFGNGWFGFLYSFFIALPDFFLSQPMLSAFLVNILLFNLLGGLCYLLGRNYLTPKYNALFLVLLFLSPILLHYNIHILSENLYIPVFLILFLGVLRYQDVTDFSGSVFLAFMVAILYYIRGEAFIYIGSLGLILLFLFWKGKIDFSQLVFHGVTIFIAFFVFISPYVWYLHSFTGEWGITNKGSSNLRQAELRGISRMDDDGFEQAVAELTSDHRHLIAGFAGGMKYDAPESQESFSHYLLANPQKVSQRMGENQKKLWTSNLPNLILGNAQSLYSLPGTIWYHHPGLLFIFLIPGFFLLFGFFQLIRNKEGYFVWSFLSFFAVASFFFTIFFVLDRYFVIFVPLFLFVLVYGVEKFHVGPKFSEHIKYIGGFLLMGAIFSLGILSYYNTFIGEDAKYEVKKEAGEWLKQNDFRTNLRVMERFPVVTYYAGSWERWITPYTDNLSALVEYARYHDIHYLVVDSVDFKNYRPGLEYLLTQPNQKYPGLNKIKEFEKNGQKVILYRIQ